jgi:hypothetical protein
VSVTAAADSEAGLQRIALRLARLFRIERVGRLEQRSAATAWRLIERRGILIDVLIAAQQQGRLHVAAAMYPQAFHRALSELRWEVGQCRPVAERRLHEVAVELRLRRGAAAAPSGLRRSVGGQLLGRS